ncbi:hypothetical protein [Streptomyces sp. NPDC057695]|uniref:hypothetical protein n=1 Tax=Streptomyces sp. NPDC057695 TaxID=3346217 RepID=UPI0036C6C213
MSVVGRRLLVVSGGVLATVGAQAPVSQALPAVPVPVRGLVPVVLPAVATVGSSASGNTCVITSHGTYSTGKTVHGSGLLGGNALQMPKEGGRNECGNVGMFCSGGTGCGCC